MRKNIAKKARRIIDSPISEFIGNLVLALVFLGPVLLISHEDFNDTIKNIFLNGVAISVVLLEIIRLAGYYLTKYLDTRLEESEKTTDAYDTVIAQYSGHKPTDAHYLALSSGKNYFSSNGCFMEIKNSNGTVTIPSVLGCANVKGDMKIVFEDCVDEYKLPDLITSYTVDIMNAHKTSTANNKETIRLDDATFSDVSSTLSLKTSRTCYYQMLLTNRCMDYNFGSKMTIRSIFEYRNKVLPLKQTKMGNQIGIEGLIITKDGWLLIEKRLSDQRTTWRDKFAQPISLSMEKKNMLLDDNQIIKSSVADAEERLRHIIGVHTKNNFGLVMRSIDNDENDDWDYEFNVQKNFLGLERDLLEGGKPNLYFYVIVKEDHLELQKKLERVGRDSEAFYNKKSKKPNSLIGEDNLRRKYYLYPIEDALQVGQDLTLAMNLRNAIRIYRTRANSVKLKFNMRRRAIFKPMYKKECGEAFLGCLSLYEICRTRIDAQLKGAGLNG